MDENNSLLNIILGPSTHFNRIILDIKLRKFQEENILYHIQGANYKFEIMLWTIQKNIQKDYIMKCKFLKNVRRNTVSIKSWFELVENKRKKK